MKIVSTIEARMTSSRLPGKVLKPILGKPTLELLIERLRRAKHVQEIVVATTINSTDDPVEALTRRLGVHCFRGSEEDVLDRVLKAAKSVQADIIVEITGDCPLVEPQVVDQVVDAYLAHKVDYVSNHLKHTFPLGLITQVFSVKILQEVADTTQDPADREHVSLHIYEHPEKYRLHNVESHLPPEYADIRLTVDTPKDYQLIRTIYENLYPSNPSFTLWDVLAFLKQRPELLQINQDIKQKTAR
jgi:spore coat polysaccharide biosynthesis protein SpsF